jgi:flagellar FliL protein
MAEKQDDIEVTEEGGDKSKLKIIIIIAVVVIVLIAVAAALFLGGDDETAEGAEVTTDVSAVKQPPIYHAVERPLIVNFSDQSQGAVRYLSIKLKVMARDQVVIDAVTLNEPAIQHELLMLFFGQKYDELNTPEGVKALQEKTLSTINGILKAEQTIGELDSVYFTSLIMQ